jgi:hypothetical protein
MGPVFVKSPAAAEGHSSSLIDLSSGSVFASLAGAAFEERCG